MESRGKRKRSDDDVGGDAPRNMLRSKECTNQPCVTSVVRGVCIACGKAVTTCQPRFKHFNSYFHSACYFDAPTPYTCRICGGATTHGDVFMYAKKKLKSSAGTHMIVGCDHKRCLQWSLCEDKQRVQRKKTMIKLLQKPT